MYALKRNMDLLKQQVEEATARADAAEKREKELKESAEEYKMERAKNMEKRLGLLQEELDGLNKQLEDSKNIKDMRDLKMAELRKVNKELQDKLNELEHKQ